MRSYASALAYFKSFGYGDTMSQKFADAFLDAEFEGGKHQRRIDLITAIEQGRY